MDTGSWSLQASLEHADLANSSCLIAIGSMRLCCATRQGLVLVLQREGPTLRILHCFQKHCLSVATNGALLFGGSPKGDIWVWDVDTYLPICTLSGHTGGVLAILPLKQQFLVSSSTDGSIRVWDLSQPSVALHIFPGDGDWWRSLIAFDEKVIGICEDKWHVWSILPGGNLAHRHVFESATSLSSSAVAIDRVKGRLILGTRTGQLLCFQSDLRGLFTLCDTMDVCKDIIEHISYHESTRKVYIQWDTQLATIALSATGFDHNSLDITFSCASPISVMLSYPNEQFSMVVGNTAQCWRKVETGLPDVNDDRLSDLQRIRSVVGKHRGNLKHEATEWMHMYEEASKQSAYWESQFKALESTEKQRNHRLEAHLARLQAENEELKRTSTEHMEMMGKAMMQQRELEELRDGFDSFEVRFLAEREAKEQLSAKCRHLAEQLVRTEKELTVSVEMWQQRWSDAVGVRSCISPPGSATSSVTSPFTAEQ